jgi:hypothetical protein
MKDKQERNLEGLQGAEELGNIMIDLRKEAVEKWDNLNINRP